ncbi:MAG: helix-turn-helix transcriptional regulator [candidate division Zixibacteria bacterium]|nr:helix-turn-helix transcriptional regulator [candidate division Zixibacteria bacterium]
MTALTPRQLQICELIGEGLTSKEIAGQLNISLNTVNKRRKDIARNLKAPPGENLTNYINKLLSQR